MLSREATLLFWGLWLFISYWRSALKVYGYTSIFSAILQKGTFFMTSYLLLKRVKLFQKVSTLAGKNLLLAEQILFFKSSLLMRWEAKMKVKELLPLKVPLKRKRILIKKILLSRFVP